MGDWSMLTRIDDWYWTQVTIIFFLRQLVIFPATLLNCSLCILWWLGQKGKNMSCWFYCKSWNLDCRVTDWWCNNHEQGQKSCSHAWSCSSTNFEVGHICLISEKKKRRFCAALPLIMSSGWLLIKTLTTLSCSLCRLNHYRRSVLLWNLINNELLQCFLKDQKFCKDRKLAQVMWKWRWQTEKLVCYHNLTTVQYFYLMFFISVCAEKRLNLDMVSRLSKIPDNMWGGDLVIQH